MSKKFIASLALGSALLAAPAVVQAQTFAVGANIGTPGIGVQVSAQANEMIVVRGAIDGLSFGRNETYSDVRYEGDAKLLTGGLFADLHPGGSAFLVSGGAYFGKRKLELVGRPTGSVEIGDVTYTPAQIGQLNGEAKLSKVQPFLGVGYDNTISGGAGADVFSIFGEAGLDRILDFSVAEGDRLRVEAGYTYATAQVGADVVVTLSGGAQAVLVNVNLSSLGSNWIFSG